SAVTPEAEREPYSEGALTPIAAPAFAGAAGGAVFRVLEAAAAEAGERRLALRKAVIEAFGAAAAAAAQEGAPGRLIGQRGCCSHGDESGGDARRDTEITHAVLRERWRRRSLGRAGGLRPINSIRPPAVPRCGSGARPQ